MNTTPYWFDDTHRMLSDALRRFIENEVVPAGRAWEEAGCVPREVLRKMGGLGFLGLRYPEKYGGAEMNVLGTALLAEELGRSSFGGFAVTVLVHTDMASPHLMNAGSGCAARPLHAGHRGRAKKSPPWRSPSPMRGRTCARSAPRRSATARTGC